MRVSAEHQVSLQAAPTWPSFRAVGASLLSSIKGLGRYFSSLGTRTTLVRDPFSAEQSRD